MLALTSWERYMGIREATAAEIAMYEEVEMHLDYCSEKEVEQVIEACSDYAFGGGKEARKQVAYWADLFWVTVDDLMTWYSVEPA